MSGQSRQRDGWPFSPCQCQHHASVLDQPNSYRPHEIQASRRSTLHRLNYSNYWMCCLQLNMAPKKRPCAGSSGRCALPSGSDVGKACMVAARLMRHLHLQCLFADNNGDPAALAVSILSYALFLANPAMSASFRQLTHRTINSHCMNGKPHPTIS
jgi:hypothetical protein